MSLEAMYGPFAPVFDNGELAIPGHLVLLGLESAGAQVVIDRIAMAMAVDDTPRWVAALFQDANWRPHLVGAIALVLEPTFDSQLLWGAIDRGSWVIPQLVVTAAFVDPLFRARVRERVDESCSSSSSPKLVASMLAMAVELPDLADWRAGALLDERIVAMLALDSSRDCSSKIVAQWSVALRAAFLVRGRTLTIAADGSHASFARPRKIEDARAREGLAPKDKRE